MSSKDVRSPESESLLSHTSQTGGDDECPSVKKARMPRDMLKLVALASFVAISVCLTVVCTILSTLVVRMAATRELLEPAHEIRQITGCGNSSQEALAAGCHFDLIMLGWVSPDCWDGELYEETMSKRGDWTWYTTDLQPLTQEEVLKGVHSGELQQLMVDWDFHMSHCVYNFRRLSRAALMGMPMMDWYGRYQHIQHCSFIMYHHELLSRDAINTDAHVYYPKCGVTVETDPWILHKFEDDDPVFLFPMADHIPKGTHW
ncbi:hypothetical protein DHEL01_v209551 [Diaporthe helianthi]|uniref:Uncharacterized protein n=1 Tax=Diaporthe helianthi TaxID=158607 RepID=A0A2P5HP68_DIAHE|nr:hypothetical protein DHEL01_v209551 [Diaporthe helianthi]